MSGRSVQTKLQDEGYAPERKGFCKSLEGILFLN